MPPVSEAASEAVVQNSNLINKMKSLRWYQRALKLQLMLQGFSMFIRLQYRGFWLRQVASP